MKMPITVNRIFSALMLDVPDRPWANEKPSPEGEGSLLAGFRRKVAHCCRCVCPPARPLCPSGQSQYQTATVVVNLHESTSQIHYNL